MSVERQLSISQGPGLTEAKLSWLREAFYADDKNRLAQNACVSHDFGELCLARSTVQQVSHYFNTKVESECKPVSNQKSSGRCWIFALVNIIRMPFMKKYNLDEFEFSQTYLYFWNKIERANYFLNAWVDTAMKGEAVDGRLLSFLLKSPCQDGGQWDMLVNVVNKYGLVPKKCFPEAHSATATARLTNLLNNLLRKDCLILRQMVEDKKSEREIHTRKTEMLQEIYNVCGICLGIPPEEFTWECYDKDKKYINIGPIAPLDFYNEHVKPIFNMDDKVCLVNDPRPENPYDKLYTVEYLGNIYANLTLYINQPIDVLKQLAAESIKNNQAVWFGCDVGKHFNRKLGTLDPDLHDYELMFGVNLLEINKADRLIYGDMCMTHAMVFTAVSIEGDKTSKWRVENSWGDDVGEKGYLNMTDEWFSNFVLEVVVDKQFVPPSVMEILKQTPTVLPAWDPMGALA